MGERSRRVWRRRECEFENKRPSFLYFSKMVLPKHRAHLPHLFTERTPSLSKGLQATSDGRDVTVHTHAPHPNPLSIPPLRMKVGSRIRFCQKTLFSTHLLLFRRLLPRDLVSRAQHLPHDPHALPVLAGAAVHAAAGRVGTHSRVSDWFYMDRTGYHQAVLLTKRPAGLKPLPGGVRLVTWTILGVINWCKVPNPACSRPRSGRRP
jgi:hypothetical protein